ncbi:MAG: DUF349 domain-containing protein [Spirochaetales bacterium]|nr:DUF349 domain-containing protein [Spirochaetales bacterium]
MNNQDNIKNDQEVPSLNPIYDKLESIINKIEKVLAGELLEKAVKDFEELKKEWDKYCPPDIENDNDILSRYTKACDNFIKQKDWAFWANYKKKEEICSHLNELLKEPVTQGTIDRFSELRNEWKNTGPIPEHDKNNLWKQYRTLCKEIYDRNLEFYKDKEKKKEENLKIKEALCLEIESLTVPEDWNESTNFVIKIQKGWDAIGQVPRDKSDALWERFQNACRDFFKRRKQFYNEIKVLQQENLDKKKELCERVEVLKSSTKWKETSSEIKQIQKEWASIGPVHWKKEKSLWEKFRGACDYFFMAQKMHFDELEKQRPENLKKKEELCVILENLHTIPENEHYGTIIHVQEEWKKIGPVPRDMEDTIWKRFRKPIDLYFEKRTGQQAAAKSSKDHNKVLKENLCIEAEEMSTSSDWRNTTEKFKELQKKWKEIGPAERGEDQALWQRFRTACDAFFDRLNDYREGNKKEKEHNFEQKLDLCIQAEIISGIPLTKEQEEERAQWQLKKLSENFWFKVVDDSDKWEDRAERIKELQREWKEIGPVSSSDSDKIWKRFQKACNYFFDNRRK